jgi:hypothetical protein
MAFEGHLVDMPVIDLLRVFQRGARSGRLFLWTRAEWAVVWFRTGQAAHAVVLEQRERRPLAAGEQAIFHVLGWAEGQFRFVAAEQPEMFLVTIKRPTAALIVEALRRRPSQGARPLPAGLSARTPLRMLPHLAGDDETVHVSVQEWLVLTRIGHRATPAELAAQTGLGLERTLALVARLIELGLVAPAPLADLPARRLTVDPPPALGQRHEGPASVTNLTRAIRRRLQQLGAASA